MKNTLNIYKPIGKTPLEVVEKFKELQPEFLTTKIGYAGRLDPMAEGVLLLLVDDLNKDKKSFENLDKEYTFTAILGIQTDTFDLLGIPTLHSKTTLQTNYKQNVEELLLSFEGELLQTYPPYSSVRVEGKPLFYWARQGKLDSITIPHKKVTIYKVENIQFSNISAENLHEKILERVNLVKGNFRQVEIKSAWEKFFRSNTQKDFTVVQASINCSTGTYVRALVHNLGQKLGSGAVTGSILRTRIGSFTIQSSKHIFEK